MMQRLVCIVIGVVCLLTSFGSPQASAQDPVAELLASMTLRQKVGQLFMVNFYGSQLLTQQADFIRDYQPGAVVLFGSNVEDRTPSQVTAYINTLQRLATTPMLIAVDQEGGKIQRLRQGFTYFPDPAILGAAADTEIAFEVGRAMGGELGAVGITMNLAPVVDLHTRDHEFSSNHVLNQRTIGQDAETVGQVAGAMVRGMADAGVVGVVKHFPGHSPTATDSHRALPTVELDRATVEATNLRAFDLAIEGGAEVVMIGHLYYPALEPIAGLPATLSPTIIELLREDMGFDGVIMSDAMEMGAIRRFYSISEASVLALQAGVDMLAVGSNASFAEQKAMIDAVYQAVEQGILSEERIEQSARRILELKYRHGVMDWQLLDPEGAVERIDLGHSHEVLVRLFEAGITLMHDPFQLLPLQPDENVAIIYPASKPAILAECLQYLPDASYQSYRTVPTNREFGAAQTIAWNADKVILIYDDVPRNRGQAAILSAMPTERTVYVTLWKPYAWELLNPRMAGFVATYAPIVEAQIALCRVLSNQVPMQGQLPMFIEGWFELGYGLTYN